MQEKRTYLSDITQADQYKRLTEYWKNAFSEPAEQSYLTSWYDFHSKPFQLNTTALAYGIVQVEADHDGGGANAEFASAHEPDLREILELGTAACNRGWWDTGIEWYEVGVAKYERGDAPTATKSEFREAILLFSLVNHQFIIVNRVPSTIINRVQIII